MTHFHRKMTLPIIRNIYGALKQIFQTILSIYDLLKLSLIKKQYHLRDKEHGLINEEISLNERF